MPPLESVLRLTALAAILPSAVSAQTGRVEHLRHGDTAIVRTTGNGIWGPLHDAVEVARIGGSTPETTFGEPVTRTALPDGGVIVFDRKALDRPALRIFDRDGKFVRNISHVGNGPGEFSADGSDMLVPAPDGSFVLRRTDGLINQYGPDGTFIKALRFDGGDGGRLDIYRGPAGTFYVRGGQRQSTDMAQVPVYRYGPTGKLLDSLLMPTYLRAPHVTYDDPLEWWIPLPDARIVSSRSDRLGFLLRSGPGLKTLVLVDVAAEPPRYLPEERAELQVLWDLSHDNDVLRGRNGPRSVVPDRKLLLARSEVERTVDGELWLRRRAMGVKGEAQTRGRTRDGKPITTSYSEPTVLSGFRVDGTYLGDVRFPPGVQVYASAIIGDFAWATTEGADGTPYLVKYRLH